MAELLGKPWFGVGVGVGVVLGVGVGVVLGVVAMLIIASSGSETTGLGPVILDSGGTIYRVGRYTSLDAQSEREDVSEQLPLTATEAVSAGWEDPILCSQGRGRYFSKGPEGEGEPYYLMYDKEDQLIGIYLHSEAKMPLPWRRWEELRGAGDRKLLGDHWGLLVYFREPERACRKAGDQDPASMADGFMDASPGLRSAPTAVVAPTPRPTVGAFLEAAADKMTSVKSLSFTLTGGRGGKRVEGSIEPPDRVDVLPIGPGAEALGQVFRFEGLGATLASIARVIQDPVDAPDAWIDNVQSRGVTGSVASQDLSALIPDAIADARVTVTLWMDAESMVRRLRIEGKVVADDPTRMVRELDLRDFK